MTHNLTNDPVVSSKVNRELKHIDWSNIKTLSIENLKHVKSNKRGTFSRQFNRRLSHWLYGQIRMRLAQACEERGVRLVLKNPAYTSQTCSECGWCERRNRNGDRFMCLRCGHECQADYNASKNLETLGLAEVYGLRSLPNFERAVQEATV